MNEELLCGRVTYSITLGLFGRTVELCLLQRLKDCENKMTEKIYNGESAKNIQDPLRSKARFALLYTVVVPVLF